MRYDLMVHFLLLATARLFGYLYAVSLRLFLMAFLEQPNSGSELPLGIEADAQAILMFGFFSILIFWVSATNLLEGMGGLGPMKCI